METNYSLMKELSEDKQKCMETLMNITELEEYYQTVSAEVDSRALNLSGTPCTQEDEPSTTNDPNTLTRHYNTCVYAVRSAWDWLIQEAKCQDVHLRNAAQYHQFHYEIRHYDQGLTALLDGVRRNANQETTNKNGKNVTHSFAKEVQDVIQQCLDYQVKVQALFETSGDIVPLHLRREMGDSPVKVLALTSYKQTEMTVVQGEEYWLVDNSEITKWKVRSMTGQEATVPAIIFLIPPPDRTAVWAASRLRQQLGATWKDSLSLLKHRARRFFSDYFNANNSKDLRCLTPAQRTDVCKCLSEIGRVLCDNDNDSVEWADLWNNSKTWGTSVLNMEGTSPDRRGMSSSLLVHWTGSRKLLRLLEECAVYEQSYQENLESSRGTKNCFVADEDGNMKYTSKAYVERLRSVDIDHLIPEDLRDNLPTIPHVSMAERVPVIPHDDSTTLEEGETLTVTSTTQEGTDEQDVISQQTIKETQTFVIVGVIDPRDKEQISIYRAISDGIISQTNGTYKNLVTGETMPIPEAMNRGLILVEYTNKSVETGELIRKGIIRTTNKTETTSFSVESVVDPVTGRKISVKEAVKRGIIDQDTGKYVNPLTGEEMSLSDAIEQNLLSVKVVDDTKNNNTEDTVDSYVNGYDSDSDLIIYGVRDPSTGRYVTLPEALDKGIIDQSSGEYVNPITGEKMSLAEAKKKKVPTATLR